MTSPYATQATTTVCILGEDKENLPENQKAKMLLSGISCDNCCYHGTQSSCFCEDRMNYLSASKNNLAIRYYHIPQSLESICGWWKKEVVK
jgi:hypothetical protein